MIKLTWCWVCDTFLEPGAVLLHHQVRHPDLPLKPPRVLSHPAPDLSRYHDPDHPNRPHEASCGGWHDWESDPT